ncbi:hypothetical protein GCM10027321_15950 [Massilia terrae]|uniref:Uncharacterized protein n=1 Tax=Massilia terrae TaxID=1811224 RepID=A0ABT2D2G6_9BURK|nr:hypothetical protein [Massilia terrae]MCS0659976.1 hypothetical protein [Massilia terrae]
MLGSTVLEVAIGLSFCFGSVALIVTTLQEALASIFRLRANTLLAGIKTMLNDPDFSRLAQAVYTHPLVNPHGGADHEQDLKAKPSYIEPLHFAIALMDSIQKNGPATYEALGAAIESIPDPQVKRAMQGLYRRAADLQQFQRLVAGWFDNAMQRMSGAYKRKQLLISFLLSLLLAVFLNIDSIHLFRTLWLHPALAAHISGAPGALDQATVDALMALPIGWEKFPPVLGSEFLLQVSGWLVTACTTLFGAPFWFDMLQRAVQMRGTGSKPAESTETQPVALPAT